MHEQTGCAHSRWQSTFIVGLPLIESRNPQLHYRVPGEGVSVQKGTLRQTDGLVVVRWREYGVLTPGPVALTSNGGRKDRRRRSAEHLVSSRASFRRQTLFPTELRARCVQSLPFTALVLIVARGN